MSNATKSKPSRTRTRATRRRGGKGNKSSASKAKAKTASSNAANRDGGKRLSPGQLDGLVLGYMKRNRGKLPVTAGTVGRAIKRSPGAVANCLGRLDKAVRVKLTNKRPREYDLLGASK